MRAIIIAIAIAIVSLGTALSASAVDKSEMEKRFQQLVSKFDTMQHKPDKAVPADVLKKARGIVLLDQTKAGFIFAYQGGTGVAMVRDKKSDDWGPVAFLKANEGSLGFQVGGQKTFLVMVLMNEDSTRMLTDSTFEVGGEARGTAGDSSSGAEGKVTDKEQSMMVYTDRGGLFGGAAVKGGALSPDSDGNQAFYGEPVTVAEILFEKKVKPTPSAEKLAQKIKEMSNKSS